MKHYFWILAIALLALTACHRESVTPDLHVAEMIIGKWMKSDQNGQPLPTNQKMVYTFVSPTKAIMSASIDARPEVGTHWVDQLEADVTISGNKVSLTSYSEEGATMVVDYNITSIDAKQFTADHKVTITLNGSVVYSVEDILRFEKVTADFSDAVHGIWEGRCTSANSAFDDGQLHRWEYREDGTYTYYIKENNNWKPVTYPINEYFVDGNLLCTRWVSDGVENREWWEIKVNGDTMKWTALRRNPDGTTATATFEMEKATVDEVRLTGSYMVSALPTGRILAATTSSWTWEKGLLTSIHISLYTSSGGDTDMGTYTFVYSGSDCTECNYSSKNQNVKQYFTYTDGRMSEAVRKDDDVISKRVTIHAYSDDGYIRSLTYQDFSDGTITDYELTWENGDMVDIIKHPVEPAGEDISYYALYDNYPNCHTGFPLAEHIFEIDNLAVHGSRHNCIVDYHELTYSNGRLVTSSQSLLTTYLTYSDGTTGRE